MQNCFFRNPATCECRNGKYARSINGDSVITCDQIIDAEAKSTSTKAVLTKSASTKTIRTKSTSKNFHILLAFLLITIALLIAISIYRSKKDIYYHIMISAN